MSREQERMVEIQEALARGISDLRETKAYRKHADARLDRHSEMLAGMGYTKENTDRATLDYLAYHYEH